MRKIVNIILLLIVLGLAAGMAWYAMKGWDSPPAGEAPEPDAAPQSSAPPQGEFSSALPPPSGSSAEAGSEPPQEEASSAPLTQRLSIPEGYTLARVGMTLEEMGICTVQEFIAAAQEGDFSEFPLIAAQEYNENRCFRLEGYLFPDTYEIYTKDSPDAILRRILANTERRISADLREQITGSGYTVDEIITLASIIEKEAFGHAPMADISSAIHNRLDIGMRLQCDVTIIYVEGAIKPFITGDKDRYNEHYNTYKCRALPAGAICNPSLAAIQAALAPSDTDYLFFVTDKDKNYYFNATWAAHDKKVGELGLK